MKNRAEMPAGKLKPNEVLERLWQHISVDFITKLPMSKGHDFHLNFILAVLFCFVLFCFFLLKARINKDQNFSQ